MCKQQCKCNYFFTNTLYFCRLIAYFGQQISDLLCVEWCLHGKQNLSLKRTRVAIINYQTEIDTLGYYTMFTYYNRNRNITKIIVMIHNYNFSFLVLQFVCMNQNVLFNMTFFCFVYFEIFINTKHNLKKKSNINIKFLIVFIFIIFSFFKLKKFNQLKINYYHFCFKF